MRIGTVLKIAFFLAPAFAVGCGGSSGGGGVPSDAVSVNDLAGSTGISRDATFVYTFSGAVASSSVTASTFFIVEGAPPHPPEGARASLIKTDAGAGFCDSTYALPADVSCPTSTQCTLTPSASLLFNNQYTACLLESITYVSGSAFEGETAPFETAASDAAFASPAPEELSFAMFSDNTANAGFAAGGEAYLLQGIGNGKFSKLSGAQFDLYYTAAAGTIDLLQTFSTEMQGDKAYIIGGLKNDGNLCPVPGGGTYSCATTETWSYDPATNDLAQGAAINNARDVAASGVVDGSIYLIGGWNPNADGENLSSVEVFDGSSWSEVDYAGRFYAVRSPAFAVVGKRVYVFGGCLQMGGCQQTMTQIFDAEENRFYQGADMSLAGRHFSGQHAVARQDRYIYVYGGATDMSATKFDDVAVYDTVANEWRTLDNTMTAERKSVGSVMLGDELYVAGGGVNSTEVGTFTPAP